MIILKEDVKNRIEWIDTAKGLGLIFVILGHLHTPYAEQQGTI